MTSARVHGTNKSHDLEFTGQISSISRGSRNKNLLNSDNIHNLQLSSLYGSSLM